VPRMKAILRAAGIAALFLMSPALYADSVLVGSGAFANPPVITFETIANGTAITNQFAAQGVILSNFWGDTSDTVYFPDSGSVVASNFSGPAGCCQIPGTLTFSTLYTLAGFEIVSNGDTTFNVTGADGITNTFILDARPTPSSGIFVGFQDLAGITGISIGPSSAVNNAFAIDNVRLEAPEAVPEPSTVGLLLAGIGLLFVMRKRIGQGLPQPS
jgi:PEP-CTERM motif